MVLQNLKKKMRESGLVYYNMKEKSKLNNLVYTVNPLPHALLNFVFDFGNLTPEDEIKYIESIILEPISRMFNENKGDLNENDFKRIHTLAKDMIVCSQYFIRSKNDVSSVSLREIRRFNIFYAFWRRIIDSKYKI